MIASSTQSSKSTKKDRPCDSCRKRKSRCVIDGSDSDGRRACVLCKFHSQECTFLADPIVRKRKSESISGTERHGAKRLQDEHLSPPVGSSVGGRILRTTEGPGVEEYDDLEGASLLKKTLGLQNLHHSCYIGPTGDLESSLTTSLFYTGPDEVVLQRGTVRRVGPLASFLLLPDSETQNYSAEINDVDAIESIVSPHGQALVNLYFRIVHPSFAILHKEVFLEKYGRSRREFSPPLLAGVYLLALNYWVFSDELSEFDRPDVSKLEQYARKTLKGTLHRPKLSTVQAGLLLLQYTAGDSAELTAQMISVGFKLGLHLDATAWNIPDWEKGLRKRLGWALYMQDKWSALGSGRPTLIASTNWALMPVIPADFPENAAHEDDQEGSSEVEKGIAMFIRMVSLTEILTELLENVFSAKADACIRRANSEELLAVLEKVKPVQLRLKDWYATLPETLSINSTQAMKLSSVGYLRLAYLATEMTLHRRILVAVSRTLASPLHEICRSAARARFISALEFMQSLKPQHIQSFWYFATASNFALIAAFGALLCATARHTEEQKWYSAKLKEYRFILKINGQNGAKFMKRAITVLDANQILLEIARKNAISTFPMGESSQVAPSSRQRDAYDSTSSHMTSLQQASQHAYTAGFDASALSTFSSPDFITDVYEPFTSDCSFNFNIGDWDV